MKYAFCLLILGVALVCEVVSVPTGGKGGGGKGGGGKGGGGGGGKGGGGGGKGGGGKKGLHGLFRRQAEPAYLDQTALRQVYGLAEPETHAAPYYLLPAYPRLPESYLDDLRSPYQRLKDVEGRTFLNSLQPSALKPWALASPHSHLVLLKGFDDAEKGHHLLTD